LLTIHFNRTFAINAQDFKALFHSYFKIKCRRHVYSHACYIPSTSHSPLFYHLIIRVTLRNFR
jgi:hypothetical protein